MPLFIDMHRLGDYTKDELEKSVSIIPDKFGVLVHYLFFNKTEDVLYCICESPSKEAIIKHHETLNVKCDSIMEIEQATTPMGSKIERLIAVGELASRISHDLRNPITTINNTIEIVKRRNPNLDPLLIPDFNRIENAVSKMLAQTECILNYVRSTPLQPRSCFIFDVIDSVKRSISVPNAIQFNIDCDQRIKLNCDSVKLEVTLINLINNAIEAIEKQGRINIRAKEDNDNVMVEIEDSGKGISSTDLDKIFEPLFTTKQFGTGLGLVSCKRIIEEHRGRIDVKSELGKGTIFTITIPKNN